MNRANLRLSEDNLEAAKNLLRAAKKEIALIPHGPKFHEVHDLFQEATSLYKKLSIPSPSSDESISKIINGVKEHQKLS